MNGFRGALFNGRGSLFDRALTLDGSAALPSLAFVSQPNTGLYRKTTSQIGVSLNGALASYFTGNGLASANAGDATKVLRGDGAWVAASGLGDLLAANNLADLANLNTALNNLGASGNFTLAGNLTVSGTGNHTFAGNVGINVTPKTWHSSYQKNVLQLAAGGALFGTASVQDLHLASNFYVTAGGIDSFIGTGYASDYWINNGATTIRVSNASGVADGPITWVNALSLAAGTGNATFSGTGTHSFSGDVSIAAAKRFLWAARAALQSPADSIITLLNNAGTDFARLQLGGTTSSFPALKRSGADLKAVLADDSGYTGFFASTLYVGAAGTAFWTSGPGTPEGAVTAPVGSLFTRSDGGAGTTIYVKESGAGNVGWVAK